MSPTAKKQLSAVIALGVAGVALGYISMGDIEENLVYYWDAQELLHKGDAAHGATVRLGGVVQRGSMQWDESGLRVNFRVGLAPEPGTQAVAVAFTGAPPQMFREGMGVVVEGKYDGTLFRADRLMVKHSNEYRPPEEGERPEQIYKTLIKDDV